MPNFELMKKPIRFKKPEDAGDAPEPFIGRAEQVRRFAQLREASAIVAELPAPGQSLHAIMTGRYDLMDTIAAVINQVGTCKILRCATLTFSDKNGEAMRNWLRDGQAKDIRLLGSLFHRDHNRELWAAMREMFAQYGGRIAGSRIHCKVTTIDFGHIKYVIEGSANLRTNSNWEQFCMMQSTELHDFHSKWIDGQIEKYEADEAKKAAGRAAKRAAKKG